MESKNFKTANFPDRNKVSTDERWAGEPLNHIRTWHRCVVHNFPLGCAKMASIARVRGDEGHNLAIKNNYIDNKTRRSLVPFRNATSGRAVSSSSPRRQGAAASRRRRRNETERRDATDDTRSIFNLAPGCRAVPDRRRPPHDLIDFSVRMTPLPAGLLRLLRPTGLAQDILKLVFPHFRISVIRLFSSSPHACGIGHV